MPFPYLVIPTSQNVSMHSPSPNSKAPVYEFHDIEKDASEINSDTKKLPEVSFWSPTPYSPLRIFPLKPSKPPES